MIQTTIGVELLCAKHEEFIDLTLQSIVPYVDEVVIVGNPNTETRDMISPFIKEYPDKVRLFWREWDGDYGAARNYALNNMKSKWNLRMDADECLVGGEWLKAVVEVLEKSNMTRANLPYEHFVYNLCMIDNTQQQHLGFNRLHLVNGTYYDAAMHEMPCNEDWSKKDKVITTTNLKIWHLGLLKSKKTIVQKYEVNRQNKARTIGFLEQWRFAQLTNNYPVKIIAIQELPDIIRNYFGLTDKNIEIAFAENERVRKTMENEGESK